MGRSFNLTLFIPYDSIMKLKTALLAIASATFLLAGSTAFAVITVNLSFDSESLAIGTTGTFSISGSATSTSGAAGGWTTASNGMGAPAASLGSGKYFELKTVSLDSTPSMNYNNAPFTQNMVGQSLIYFDASLGGYSSLTIYGSTTLYPVGALFEIGNGTTDYVSGTFIVEYSNVGAFTTGDLSGSFGSDGVGTNVDLIVAAAVPEPSAYAAMAGLAALGLAAVRRRRVGRSIPARKVIVPNA
jgi:hypothetical protein